MAQLFRPELAAAAGVCVVIGEILAFEAFPPAGTVAVGFLCGFLLSGSALILNDYFDVETDKINGPLRPLAAGVVSPPTAIGLGLLTAFFGLVTAFAIHPVAFVISAGMWGLGFLYNWRLKAAGLWGNLIVSTSAASTFLIGSIAAGQIGNRLLWVFSLLVFCFDLAEEIASDAVDAEGDQKRGSRSIAIVYGKAAALRLSGVMFGVAGLLSVLLVMWGAPSFRFQVVIPLTDMVTAYFVIKLLTSHHDAERRSVIRAIYLAASFGLVAFVVGSLV